MQDACRKVSAVAALALLACGCRPDAAPAPAARPAITDADLAAFLAANYGPEALPKTSWPGEDDGVALVRSVCASGSAPEDPRRRWLLAVCTEVPDAGHAQSGAIDAFVLAKETGGVRTLASERGVAFGSGGQPGVVTLVRAGFDRPGFLLREAWTGQGYLIGTQSLVVFDGEQLRTVARLREALEHPDDATCAAPPCTDATFDVDFDLRLDATDPTRTAYPLLVHEHGRECGATVDRDHRLEIDAATGTYRVPAALMREDCLLRPETNPGESVP